MGNKISRVFSPEDQPSVADSVSTIHGQNNTKGFAMFFKKNSIAVLAMALVISFAAPLMAGESMVFKQKLPDAQVVADACVWKNLGSVQFVATKNGYVVVTASGMAFYGGNSTLLVLSLAAKAAVQGPWIFDVTADFQPYQAYTVRMVFQVSAGKTYNFYLNGRSCNDNAGTITVQTGSFTAEFYAKADVTPLTEPKPEAEGAQADQNATDNPLINHP